MASMTTGLSAPLIRPVRFSSLVSQLSPTEITSFINNVNPKILIDALSCYFIESAANTERIKQNDICNSVISSIIESRDQLPSKPIIFKLHALPSGLIGACGSYLDQRSYARLSTANRNIYLGCNTPNTLKEVMWRYQSRAMHEMLNFPAISSANTLAVESGEVNENGLEKFPLSVDEMHVIASQIAKMSRLQSLDVALVNSEFIGIIASHETTNQRVHSLSVCLWEEDEGARDRLISSITAFKHIQFLKVRGSLWAERPLDEDSVIKPLVAMCSDLRGLDLIDDEDNRRSVIEISLLRAIGHRLHYLHLNLCDNDQVAALKNVNFQNLRELKSLYGGDPISAVLNTAVNLEKIRLRNDTDTIVKVLTKCKRLRYLELKDISNMEMTLDALERGLFQTKNLRRDRLKIRISTSRFTKYFAQHFPISKPEECIIKLDRIVNSLSVKKVDQWMIILELQESCCDDPKQFIDSLGWTADIAEIHVVQDGDNNIVAVTIL